LSKEQKKIARSGTLNLLAIYLTFFLGIANTFFIARLLSPEIWGILIFSLTFLASASFFCTLIPPSAEGTLQYYIPKFKREENDNNLIRHFIFHIYKLRFGIIIVVFIVFHITIQLLSFSELITQALIVLSPMIILGIIQNLNNSLLIAFQKFKKAFIVNLVNTALYFIGTMFIFFQNLNEPLILIVIIYVLSAAVSCGVSIFFIMSVIPHKTKDSKIENSMNKTKYLRIHTDYGLFLTISGVVSSIIGSLLAFMYLYFGVIEYLTYVSICYTFLKFAANFSGSSKSVYIAIFSEIDWKENLSEFKTLFYQVNKYLLLSVSIIIGALFFFIQLAILIIYTETYLIIILSIQLFLISAFAGVINRNILIITQSTDRTRINLYLKTFQSFGNFFVGFIALLFFDFFILILFFCIIMNLMPFLGIYLINRKSGFKLNIYLIFKPYLLFLISLLISTPFTWLINLNIFPELIELNLFINGLIRAIIFFFIFYLIIFFTKYFTREEFDQIIDIIPISKIKNPLIQKIVKLVGKILPSQKV